MGEDFTAVNAALGRMIASAPSARVMDTYNAFASIVKPEVPSKLMSGVDVGDARRAYSAFLEFKDVVKAAQASYAESSPGLSRAVSEPGKAGIADSPVPATPQAAIINP